MSDLGQLLKKARTERGISLDDIQESTKIRKRYLEAIEEGNYKALPGNFYVRAFIKSYAETVGLDPDEVLRLYRNVIPETHVEQTVEPVIRKRRSTHQSERTSRWASSVVMWAFPILIVAVVYIYYVYSSKPDSDPNLSDSKNITDKAGTAETKKPEPPTTPVNTGGTETNNGSETGTNNGQGGTTTTPPSTTDPVPETNVPATIAFVKKEGRVDHYTVTGKNKMKVEMTIGDAVTWTEVRKENGKGEKLQSGSLEAGKTMTFEVDHALYIVYGKGNKVEIKVDGQLIDDGDGAGSKRLLLEWVPQP